MEYKQKEINSFMNKILMTHNKQKMNELSDDFGKEGKKLKVGKMKDSKNNPPQYA